MKIDRLILGAYQTNCYILRSSEAAKDCLVVDTGLQAGGPVEFLSEHNLNPIAVVLTHGHIDHVGGVAALRERYSDVKVYIHKLDARMLTPPLTREAGLTEARSNLSELAGEMFSTEPADFLIEEESPCQQQAGTGVIELAGIKLEVLHTPGHTQGGMSLYAKDEGIVFVGDTLFASGIGRTDLGGNMAQLIKSINEKLFTLPDETAVYPGHGPTTTIAQEKANNPFLQ